MTMMGRGMERCVTNVMLTRLLLSDGFVERITIGVGREGSAVGAE